MKKTFKRSDSRFLLALIAVHTAFFLLALVNKKIYNGDSAEYIYMAVNIKERFWFYCGNPAMSVIPEYLTLRPPLYSIFIALIYLVAVNSWLVILVQNFISIYNIWYTRQTIRLIGYSRKYDWILIAFVLLYPAQFVHTNTIAPDILLQACVLVYFRHFILLLNAGRWRHGLVMSLALIAGMLVKPVLYPFTFVHCILMLVVLMYLKRGLFRPFVAAVLPMCVLLLFGMWNFSRTGKMHFTSTQSFNAIFYYYCYISDKHGIDAGTEFLQHERAKMAAIPYFKDRYNYANNRGMQLLKENFVPYILYHIRNSARMFIDPGKAELDMFTGRLTLSDLYKPQEKGFFALMKNEGWDGYKEYIYRNPSLPVTLIILFFNLLKVTGFILFMFSRFVSLNIKMFVLLLLGYFAITTGPIANTRYLIPVSLIFIGCSVIGFQHLLLRYRNKAIIVSAHTN